MKKPSPMPSCAGRRRRSAAHLGFAQGMMAGPRGDVGLADALENLRRKAGAVILDRDAEDRPRPSRPSMRDPAELAKSAAFSMMLPSPCSNSGARQTWGSGSSPLGRRDGDDDFQILAAIGRRRCRRATRPTAAARWRPACASSGLARRGMMARQRSAWLAQQAHILDFGRIFRQTAFQFARHHRDGAERRAQLMRRRRRQARPATPDDVRAPAPAAWRQARRHARGFAGDAPGIDRGEADADHQRRPDAGLIKLRQTAVPRPRAQGNGPCTDRDQRRRRQGDAGQDQRIAQIEGRGGDHHRAPRTSGRRDWRCRR